MLLLYEFFRSTFHTNILISLWVKNCHIYLLTIYSRLFTPGNHLQACCNQLVIQGLVFRYFHSALAHIQELRTLHLIISILLDCFVLFHDRSFVPSRATHFMCVDRERTTRPANLGWSWSNSQSLHSLTQPSHRQHRHLAAALARTG